MNRQMKRRLEAAEATAAERRRQRETPKLDLTKLSVAELHELKRLRQRCDGDPSRLDNAELVRLRELLSKAQPSSEESSV